MTRLVLRRLALLPLHPARRRRGDVRARRGLALRPGRRLRRRGVPGEPGAAGGDRRRRGASTSRCPSASAAGSRTSPRATSATRSSPAASPSPARSPRAPRSSLAAGRRRAGARAGRRPRLRRARGRAARHGRRLGDPRAELLQHRRAVVLGRAARALRVLDRARLAARGRHLGPALGRRLGRRPRAPGPADGRARADAVRVVHAVRAQHAAGGPARGPRAVRPRAGHPRDRGAAAARAADAR